MADVDAEAAAQRRVEQMGGGVIGAHPAAAVGVDIKADISESNDVAAENPKVVAQLKKLMIREHTPSEFYPIKPLD